MEKTEIKKSMWKNTINKSAINVDEYCYPVHQFILPLANSYCPFPCTIQIYRKIPVMDFTFRHSFRLKACTLPKMCSFTSISKGFCSDFQLSLKISQHFRTIYFPKNLLTELLTTLTSFKKIKNPKNYIYSVSVIRC